MAGLRQGLAPLHLKGRNAVEDGADRRLLPREECVEHAGEETLGQPLQQRARGAAVPCQPKPLTRTWVSAVLGITRQGDFADVGCARSISG